MKNRTHRQLLNGLAQLALAASVASPVAVGCGGQTERDQVTGSETHFLTRCSRECGAGLECLGNVCTLACTTDDACSSLSTAAACIADPGAAGPATCDVPCVDASDCAVVGPAHACDAGFCRAAALEGGIGSLSAGFSRMELRRIGERPGSAASLCDPLVFIASVVVEPSTHRLAWSYCDPVGRTDTYAPSEGVMPVADADIATVLGALRELRLSGDATCTPQAGILTLDVTTPDGVQASFTDSELAGCSIPAVQGRRFVDDLTEVWNTLGAIRNP